MAKQSNTDENQEFNVISNLSVNMAENGFELLAFGFMLEPLLRLPKNKLLQELYFDEMKKKFGEEAIKYLWFALKAIRKYNLDPLVALIQSKMPEMEPEVMYRKLLTEIVSEIASDSEEGRSFINYVVDTKVLGNHTKSKMIYSPPQHERQNANVYAPYILKFFQDADRLQTIRCDDLSKLEMWLDKCGQIKALTMVKEFIKDNKKASESNEGESEKGKKLKGLGARQESEEGRQEKAAVEYYLKKETGQVQLALEKTNN